MVAIVVVALVLLSLVALGVFRSPGCSTSGTQAASSTPAYGGASSAANSAASCAAGGPWEAVAGVGIDAPTGAYTNISSATSANCSFTPTGSEPITGTLRIPGYAGPFSSGSSPWWGMVYVQRSAQQILLVQVLNGTALPLAVGTGTCVHTFENLTDLPSNVVDSSTAASTAWTDGGSAFVAAHSSLSLNQEMLLVGGENFNGIGGTPFWAVSYSPCGVVGGGGPSGTQPEFLASINALTGHLMVASNTTTTCGTGSTLAPAESGVAGSNPTLLGPADARAGAGAYRG